MFIQDALKGVTDLLEDPDHPNELPEKLKQLQDLTKKCPVDKWRESVEGIENGPGHKRVWPSSKKGQPVTPEELVESYQKQGLDFGSLKEMVQVWQMVTSQDKKRSGKRQVTFKVRKPKKKSTAQPEIELTDE